MYEIKNDDYLFIHKIASEVCNYFYTSDDNDIRFKKQWTDKIPLKKDDLHKIQPYSVIFADLTFIYEICRDFNQHITVPFYLFTCETDFSVPFLSITNSNLMNQQLLDNLLLIKWFSINVTLINHPKLICLPLGLPKNIPQIIYDDNQEFIGWDIYAKNSYISYYLNNSFENFSIIQNFTRDDKKLLYFKMTIQNSDDCDINHEHFNIRSITKKYLLDNNLIDDYDDKLIDWRVYMKELKEYKFCLSLPGKGLDCYRTWECLTIGVIPIVLNTELSILYDDLPVVIINNINELTFTFLEKQFEKIRNNICFYNFDKLKCKFWINFVNSKKLNK